MDGMDGRDTDQACCGVLWCGVVWCAVVCLFIGSIPSIPSILILREGISGKFLWLMRFKGLP